MGGMEFCDALKLFYQLPDRCPIMKMFAEFKTEINQSAALQELLPVNWRLSVGCRPRAATSVTCNRLHCLHTWAHGREGARDATRKFFLLELLLLLKTDRVT